MRKTIVCFKRLGDSMPKIMLTYAKQITNNLNWLALGIFSIAGNASALAMEAQHCDLKTETKSFMPCEKASQVLSVTPPVKKNKTRSLHKAVIAKNIQKIRTIIEKKVLKRKYSLDVLDENNWTPLLLACSAQCGNTQVAMLLIEGGADVQYQTSDGTTPLNLAIENGYNDIAAAIVFKMKNADVKNAQGLTPLSLACMKKNMMLCSLLVAKGANPAGITSTAKQMSAVDKEYMLCEACSKSGGQLTVVKALVEAGADINYQNSDGYTPLMLSCNWWSFTEIPFYLLAHGSKATTLNTLDNNWTALKFAIKHSNIQLIRALVSKGAHFGTSLDFLSQDEKNVLFLAVCGPGGGDAELMKALFANGADIDYQSTSNGNTGLMLACECQHIEIAVYLIPRVMRIDVVNYDGWSAFGRVCQRPNLHLIKLFLARKARIPTALGKLNQDEKTYLLFELCNAREEYIELVKAL